MSKFELLLSIVFFVLALLALPCFVEHVYTHWDAPEVPPRATGDVRPEYEEYCLKQKEARESYVTSRSSLIK